MLQKIEINHIATILTPFGKIDETLPIDLSDYITPRSSYQEAAAPLKLLPSQIKFSMKMGGTTFDVNTHFSTQGRQCVLEQFKNLILSKNLI